MKRILLLLLLSIVLVSGAVCQQPGGISPTLVRYTVSGDGFSVNLHSRPTMTTTKVSQKDGTERTKRSLTTTVNSVAYSIEIFENLNPRQPLEEFIAESNASFEYDPATERNLTVDGFTGKEYSSQTNTTTTVMQFFATEDRLFRFAATGPAVAAASIKEFFSSIKLGPNTDGFDVSSGVFVELYNGERVYLGRDVDVKARLLTKPEPTYTEDARDKKVEGTVILRAVLAKTGRVERIRVDQGLPYGLTVQAIEAARKIAFVPAMKDGKAVSMWIQLEYYFSL
jgi:TonB family protein